MIAAKGLVNLKIRFLTRLPPDADFFSPSLQSRSIPNEDIAFGEVFLLTIIPGICITILILVNAQYYCTLVGNRILRKVAAKSRWILR